VVSGGIAAEAVFRLFVHQINIFREKSSFLKKVVYKLTQIVYSKNILNI